MEHQRRFIEQFPTRDAYWRGIILFGRISASYKFALAEALFEVVGEDKSFVTLEELADPYSRHLTRHQERVDRQGLYPSSRFLDACRDYNRGEIGKDELVAKTVQFGFADVLDAFHNVNQSEIPIRFFVDERKSRNGITITDELFDLSEDFQYRNLPHEVEARWRVVETAWSLSLSPKLLVAKHDPATDRLYVEVANTHRTDVTSCRDALNGYQKGKCFYCSSKISVEAKDDEVCDVDHYFPHILAGFQPPANANLDGVWNLVLTCRVCNRGPDGKFARVPDIKFLERLDQRNNYLIQSHHPLRETLIAQTGRTEAKRRTFLQRMDTFAIQHLVARWRCADEEQPAI